MNGAVERWNGASSSTSTSTTVPSEPLPDKHPQPTSPNAKPPRSPRLTCPEPGHAVGIAPHPRYAQPAPGWCRERADAAPAERDDLHLGDILRAPRHDDGHGSRATGYENIIMRSVLIGAPFEEARARVSEIEAFSELGDDLRFPMRTLFDRNGTPAVIRNCDLHPARDFRSRRDDGNRRRGAHAKSSRANAATRCRKSRFCSSPPMI